MGVLVAAWKQLPEQYSGSDLHSAFLNVIAAADGSPHRTQLTQLHRGRMGLFFGLIATAINLGIIRQKRRLPASPQVVNRAAKPAGAAQQTYRSLARETAQQTYRSLAREAAQQTYRSLAREAAQQT